MTPTVPRAAALKTVRCAIYTRKSTEEGLDQEFNSLDAQREGAQAYVASQQHAGWALVPDRFDDGGYTGGNMDRPALAQLLRHIAAGQVDCVVVYKVDRLSRSLLEVAMHKLREAWVELEQAQPVFAGRQIAAMEHITGRFSIRSGTHSVPIGGGREGLTQWEVTIAELLSGAGYATGHFGKWHLGSDQGRLPNDQGFDEWFGIPRTTDEAFWPAEPAAKTTGV